MHESNRIFWNKYSKEYPRYFNDPSRIIEMGSTNINGSIRNHFNCRFYVGVDWTEGDCVDLISLAHEVSFEDGFFDTVVSASMLEHDPFWPRSITNMIRLMKQDGILILSWGGAYNNPHCVKSAPDGKFHNLKAGLLLEFLETRKIYVHRFHYEWSLCPENKQLQISSDLRGKVGTTALVAFKDKFYASGERIIEDLLEKDKS